MSSRFHPLTRAAAVAAAVMLSSQTLSSRVFAQDDADPEMRIERLENQLRELTGQNEELQHRNQLLEQQLRQLQGAQPAPGARPVQSNAAPAAPPAQTYTQGGNPQAGYPQGGYPQTGYNQPPAQQPGYGQPQPGYGQSQPGYREQQIAAPPPIVQEPPVAGPSGRRGDAFDPSQNPNAPGAPRALGGGQLPIQQDVAVGAPGGRAPGEPLDLSRPGAGNYPQGNYQQGSYQQGNYQQGNPPPVAPNNPNGPGLATAPPSNSPRDEFDLGLGYMQRKDYALAEQTMKNFAQKYPSDPMLGDSQYWLGESYFQRQQYRDAAETFLAVTSKYEKSAKAPDALLRLGQSLAALKEKEAACAAFGEISRKYPRASTGVKAAVDREQKRVKC